MEAVKTLLDKYEIADSHCVRIKLRLALLGFVINE